MNWNGRIFSLNFMKWPPLQWTAWEYPIKLTLLKPCVRYFYKLFISQQMIALQKLWKMFLFHLNSSFRSQDIQIFVSSSSLLFPIVSHCFRGWSRINLNKVYDIINCVNKNLLTHFVWSSLMIQYKVVFELFQKLHLQIYAIQFMTS